MDTPRSTFERLRDRMEALLLERLPAVRRPVELARQLGRELGQWREWSTRLVLAERWARCAAEHPRDSHWRPLLSAYAIAALLADDLDQLRVDLLAERAAWAEQYGRDPSTGQEIATPEQQVGVVVRAMLEELIAAQKAETRHYYDPISDPGGDPHRNWDQQKLAQAARDLVISATNQAITIATQRLGLAAPATVSH